MVEGLVLVAILAVLAARLALSDDASSRDFSSSFESIDCDLENPWFLPMEGTRCTSDFRSSRDGAWSDFVDTEGDPSVLGHDWDGGWSDWGDFGSASSSSLSWESPCFGHLTAGPCINPATGLPMMSDSMAGLDVGGSAYGFNHDDSWSSHDMFDGGCPDAASSHDSWSSPGSGSDWP